MVPFTSYASRGQIKPRLFFSRINGPNLFHFIKRSSTFGLDLTLPLESQKTPHLSKGIVSTKFAADAFQKALFRNLSVSEMVEDPCEIQWQYKRQRSSDGKAMNM